MCTHWVIETKIEPKSAADAEHLACALAQIASEDPTFGYSRDRGSGAVVVTGTDETNLDAHLATLERLCAGKVRVGTAQVRYREALERAVNVDYTHSKQSGAGGEFARVRLRLEPNEPGTGSAFKSEIAGGVVPDEYIGGVESGVQSVSDSGVLLGFPMDAKVALYDGAYHEIDSSWVAFEIAARSAMWKGAAQAGVKLLEPIMDVLVATPGEFVGLVIDDINDRHGRIRSQRRRGDADVILASAQLARLLGYVPALRSITNSRATSRMRFRTYAEVQRNDGPDDFSPAAAMRA